MPAFVGGGFLIVPIKMLRVKNVGFKRDQHSAGGRFPTAPFEIIDDAKHVIILLNFAPIVDHAQVQRRLPSVMPLAALLLLDGAACELLVDLGFDCLGELGELLLAEFL